MREKSIDSTTARDDSAGTPQARHSAVYPQYSDGGSSRVMRSTVLRRHGEAKFVVFAAGQHHLARASSPATATSCDDAGSCSQARLTPHSTRLRELARVAQSIRRRRCTHSRTHEAAARARHAGSEKVKPLPKISSNFFRNAGGRIHCELHQASNASPPVESPAFPTRTRYLPPPHPTAAHLRRPGCMPQQLYADTERARSASPPTSATSCLRASALNPRANPRAQTGSGLS